LRSGSTSHEDEQGAIRPFMKGRITMRSARYTLAAGLLVAGMLTVLAVGFCAGGERPVRFAVIGDRTGSHEPGIHGQVLAEIERLRPDFVVGVGDMIEGYTDDIGSIDNEWQEYKRLLEALSMPIYLIPGNHDIWDEQSLERYRHHVGEPYYSFDVEDIHFIVLDTSRWDEVDALPAEQIEWAEDDLGLHAGANHTIAVLHKPYWIETIAAGEPDPLHSVFVEHGVDAVFTGHYHIYFSGEFDGILYTGIGSSGGGCDPGITGLTYHFAWVTVGDDDISIAPIKMGAVLPWDEVTADLVWLLRRVQSEAILVDRVEVGRELVLPRTEVAVSVCNLDTINTMRGDLEWDVPGAWSVTPRKLPVAIAPSETHKARFNVETDGPLYPVPVLQIRYPYAEGETFDIDLPLTVVRSVDASRLTRPPAIDGVIEGAEIWRDPVVDFFAPDGSPVTADPVEFYFAWDESTLYIAADCMETDMGSLVSVAGDHDGAVYGEDCVGFFLQPEIPDGPVYQVYFNAIGTAFDQKITVENGRYTEADREWNGVYVVKTHQGPDRWVIEIAIPLDQLGTKGSYEKTWALNFRRKQRRLNTSADWQVPVGYDSKDYGVLHMR
jgi:predicted phosphodiesterase